MPGDQAAAADAQHPWLGLAFFTEETRGYFYGREEEIAELARRVRRKTLTVLFGQSGLGKTSILRAGIVPRLRPEGFCPVYVRIDYGPDAPAPAEQIKQAIFRTTQASGQWTHTGVAVAGESLWEFLHHRDDILRDEQGKVLIPLLIFDQFEEIFTLAQSDDFGRRRAAEFIEDLADLVENRSPKALEARMESDDAAAERFDFARSDYRILIALREDYLAHLEGFRSAMPSIAANRMRLARMTGAQALDAVVKPGGALVSEEVAAAIVRFVAGGTELANAEVEPSLLSLICLELNNARIAQGRNEIATDLLAGSHAGILNEFYERALADQPAGLRRVIEDQLLTEAGFRESLAEERLRKAFADAGATPDALAKLVDRRLLRIEERLDVRRVELTHDVLCGVVKSSRDQRLEREAREQAERRLQEQHERARATRKALARARQIAAGCALLAVVAIGASVFGYLNMQRAQHTRAMAEQARGEAEKLVGYLLDDFQDELEPVGRLDIVGDLARRAVAYYDALPEELRNTESDRNRALAQTRLASVLLRQGRTDQALPLVNDAAAALDRLNRPGTPNELIAIGLSRTFGLRSMLRSTKLDYGGALPEAERALDVIRPLALANGASAAVRRTYGEALLRRGYILMRTGRFADAAQALQESSDVFRTAEDFALPGSRASLGYVNATGWLVEAQFRLGHDEEALRAGADALPIAERILQQRPEHRGALWTKALVLDSMSVAAGDTLQWTRALELATLSERAWEALIRNDASFEIARNNRADSRLDQSDALEHLGRPRDAVERRVSALRLFVGNMASNSDFLEDQVTYWQRAADLYGDLGDAPAAQRAIAEVQRVLGEARFTSGSFWAAMTSLFGRAAPLSLQRLRGEDVEVLQAVPDLSQSLRALVPESGNDGVRRGQLEQRVYSIGAESAYATADFARAEELSRLSVESVAKSHSNNAADLRPIDTMQALRALALARLERRAEARELLAPVLKQQRQWFARGKEDQLLRVELARTLLAQAVVDPAGASRALQEAQALLAGLAPDMRNLKSVVFWRQRIDQALHGGA